ncbi:MAG TPA: alpha/beta hydrolase, partial [Miltoncostaeaceae bacterium]|nr:alpha/beta hydrolase [Miltoncostaeaceae bacterium]
RRERLPACGRHGRHRLAQILRETVAAVPATRWEPFAAPAPDETLAGVCVGWPDVPGAALPSAPPPDVPVLLLSGAADTRTPVETARVVRAAFPRATHVVVRGARHSLVASGPPCVGTAVRRFLAGRSPAGACRGVDVTPPVSRLAPRTLAAVPARGLPGRRGRTLNAVRLTLADVPVAVDLGRPAGRRLRITGLRGGTGEVRPVPAGLLVRLTRYEVVAGVRLTGALLLPRVGAPVLRVRVSGPAAPAGAVVLGPGRASGRLGGRPFALRG